MLPCYVTELGGILTDLYFKQATMYTVQYILLTMLVNGA